MNLWRSLEGMMEVELTSAEPELALERINNAKISVYHVRQKNPLTFLFSISRADYPMLSKLCEKQGENLKIIRKFGLFWTAKSLAHRPTLLVGMTLLLLIVLFLPSRVFFVQVEGNTSVPARKILAAAEECGIRFGASRRLVRSEKVKNTLLSSVPELQWAGVNTAGCVATISVRERAVSPQKTQAHEVTSIVAARDGFILSGTVTSGSPLFTVGQTVKAGETLVSGYTDTGLCIRAGKAEAEIYAQTNHEQTVITPSSRLQRGSETGTEKKISLILGKNRIKLWKGSGNLDAGCGRIEKNYRLTLPGGFALPVTLCVERFSSYEMSRESLSSDQVEAALREYAENYLTQTMVAGEILQRSEALFQENGIYSLEGEYRCREMISRVHREQIGDSDTNGENS